MNITSHTRPFVPNGPQALMALARQHRSPLEQLDDLTRRDLMRQTPRSERRSKSIEWRAGELVEVETAVTEWAAPSRAPERSRAAPAPKAVARSEPAPDTSSASKPQDVAPEGSAADVVTQAELEQWFVIPADDADGCKRFSRMALYRLPDREQCQVKKRGAYFLDLLKKSVLKNSNCYLVHKSELEYVKAEMRRNKHAGQHLISVKRSWLQ